jgi:hypothetical protein
MDVPHSPVIYNNIIRLGLNKKTHIIKGIRYIKTELKIK